VQAQKASHSVFVPLKKSGRFLFIDEREKFTTELARFARA
jgi:hypothetical protein